MRSFRFLVLIALCLTIGACLTPLSASAHASLKTAVPAPGATVTTPPTRVLLTFSEETSATKSGGTVTDANGAVVSSGFTVDLNARTNMTIALPPNLPNGTYTVTWKTLTEDDNGMEDGTFTFTVGAPTRSGTPTTAAPTMPTVVPAVATIAPATPAPTATVAAPATAIPTTTIGVTAMPTATVGTTPVSTATRVPTATLAATTAPASPTPTAPRAPAATGTGGGTSTGVPTALPQTGRGKGSDLTLTVAWLSILAGLMTGIGLLLRFRAARHTR